MPRWIVMMILYGVSEHEHNAMLRFTIFWLCGGMVDQAVDLSPDTYEMLFKIFLLYCGSGDWPWVRILMRFIWYLEIVWWARRCPESEYLWDDNRDIIGCMVGQAMTWVRILIRFYLRYWGGIADQAMTWVRILMRLCWRHWDTDLLYLELEFFDIC